MTDLRSSFERAIRTALEEDLGGTDITVERDLTTSATVAAHTMARGRVVAKQAGVVCGLEALEIACHALDQRVSVDLERKDGDPVEPGDVLATLEGPARAILGAERTALNLIGHLSGVATLTGAFADRAGEATILETRKTTPGLRTLEKYAVATGGGTNHRFGLFDGVLVKDNHISLAGSVGEAVRRAMSSTTKPVQVECTTAAEVEEALAEEAGSILLDNRSPQELRELTGLIRARNPGVLIEASGGITMDNVAEIAATGVDRISIGALTHSAPAFDLSLELEGTGD